MKTTNGKRGGNLVGKPHNDKNGNPVGGIKAVVTDAGGKPVELEGGEVIINKEASKKHWKELSRINQSAGNGVPISAPIDPHDEDPSDYKVGGKIIEFNRNKLPNQWVMAYAKKIKKDHPEIWKLGGNIYGNTAFENLLRVLERGYWLDSEEWMYMKWQSFLARHQHDFRIAGVVAVLKWGGKVNKGWVYMKNLIEDKIKKGNAKPKSMKDGGSIEYYPKGTIFQTPSGDIEIAEIVKVEGFKNGKHRGSGYRLKGSSIMATFDEVERNLNKGIWKIKIGDEPIKRDDYFMKDGGSVEFKPEKKGTLIKGSEIIKYAEKVNGNYRLVFYRIKETKGKVPTLCDAFDYCKKIDTNNVTPDELIELIENNNLMEQGGKLMKRADGSMKTGGSVKSNGLEQLEKIKDEYSKLYPKLTWELKSEEKTNYSPSSDVIYFEGDKFYPKRFILVENLAGYRDDIASKFGQYKLHIYLHPIINIYGEDTAEENPTISKSFDHYPSVSEIKKELQNKKSSWFDKMKAGGNVVTYKNKFNKKYGFESNESHSLAEISKATKIKISALQDIYDKGIGAYKTNPQSVRPNVKSKEQWAMARVYSAVMGGKAARVDSNELQRGKKYAKGSTIESQKKEWYIKPKNSDLKEYTFLGESPIVVKIKSKGEITGFYKLQGVSERAFGKLVYWLIPFGTFRVTDEEKRLATIDFITKKEDVWRFDKMRIPENFWIPTDKINFDEWNFTKEQLEKFKRTDSEETYKILENAIKELQGRNSALKSKYADGGNVLVVGKIYSGKSVIDAVSKYDSSQGTDMEAFAKENIKLNDKYKLDYVDVQDLIVESCLNTFISDQYDDNRKVQYREIEEPILLDTDEYNRLIVLDGYHRVLQALYNNEDKILAYKKLSASKNKYADGGSVKNDCIEFIKNSESLINNGYYRHIKNLDVYVGAGDKTIPKIKSLILITYNSGKASDTINSSALAQEVAKLIGGNISVAKIIVSEQMIYANRISLNLLKGVENENIIIADRDRIVCTNITANYEDGGSVGFEDMLFTELSVHNAPVFKDGGKIGEVEKLYEIGNLLNKKPTKYYEL